MTDREEHNAEIDAGYWSDYEEEPEEDEIFVTPEDALEWLTDLADGEVPEEAMEFLLDALDAVKDGNSCSVYILAANFADKHERELKEYVRN